MNTCIHLLEAASLPGKSLSFEHIWTNHRGKALRRAFSGCRFLAKQIGHQHQPVGLGKLKMPRFLAFCDPRAVEKLQKMTFLQGTTKGAAEKQPKNEHLAILPRGAYVFVTRKSFESHKNS